MRKRRILHVLTGKFHVVFFSDECKLWSCGGNSMGRLGIGKGDVKKRNKPTKILVPPITTFIKATCHFGGHNMFMDSFGRLYNNGHFSDGELGYGIDEKRRKIHVPTLLQVDELKGMIIKDFFSSYGSFVINQDDQIYCCGYNPNGQLGLQKTGNVSTFTHMSFFQKIVVKYISPSENHTLFLTVKCEVYACGQNADGQCGVKRAENRMIIPNKVQFPNDGVIIEDVSAGGYHSLFLTSSNRVIVAGRNSNGQIGLDSRTGKKFKKIKNEPSTYYLKGLENERVVQISAGQSHSMFLTARGVFMCGRSYALDKSNNRDNWTPTLITDLVNIIEIAAGYRCSFAVNNQGEVFSIGSGGVTGLGSNRVVKEFTKIPDFKILILKKDLFPQLKFSRESYTDVVIICQKE